MVYVLSFYGLTEGLQGAYCPCGWPQEGDRRSGGLERIEGGGLVL